MRTRAKHPDPTSQRSRILQLEQAARPLEPDAGERDRLLRAAHAYAQHFLDKLPETPAYNHDKSGALQLRDLAAGPGPRPIDQLLERIDESVVRPGLKPSHAGHLAYIPGGGIYASSLADYLAAVTNEYAGVRFAGPGAVEMEDLILDWMAKVVGFPETADGNLASGGSVASLIAVVAAREAAGLRGRDFHRAVVYASPHIHQCLHKALRVAGLGESVRRDVAVDEGRRLCPESLSEAIAADRDRGLRPWLVLASAGTADTGAVDPLSTIADITAAEGLWYHVDAAYGGFFAMLPEFRPALSGMERADSIVLDPHKGMFLPTAPAPSSSGTATRSRTRTPTTPPTCRTRSRPRPGDGRPPPCRRNSPSTSAGCGSGCRCSCTAKSRSGPACGKRWSWRSTSTARPESSGSRWGRNPISPW